MHEKHKKHKVFSGFSRILVKIVSQEVAEAHAKEDNELKTLTHYFGEVRMQGGPAL